MSGTSVGSIMVSAPKPTSRSDGVWSRYSPSLETAFRIARVFRVPLDDVFQYSDGQR